MPCDVGAELAEDEHGEGGGADAVDVVVAVHADARPCLDRSADPFDRKGHVAKQERVVAGELRVEEATRDLRIPVATAHEHAGGDLVQSELAGERARSSRGREARSSTHPSLE